MEGVPLKSQNVLSDDGAASHSDALGLDPIRNDDHARPGPYGDHDRGL